MNKVAYAGSSRACLSFASPYFVHGIVKQPYGYNCVYFIGRSSGFARRKNFKEWVKFSNPKAIQRNLVPFGHIHSMEHMEIHPAAFNQVYDVQNAAFRNRQAASWDFSLVFPYPAFQHHDFLLYRFAR
jgi:hypothetical protein